jgi:ribosomal protein L35
MAINKNPILPTNYNKSHIMTTKTTKESKLQLSNQKSIHITDELYLIDLCPSRRKLIVGVDSQIADNKNYIVAYM